MNKPTYFAGSLPPDKACFFLLWDFLDNESRTIECLFLTLEPEELIEGFTSDLINSLKKKEQRRIVVRKKLEYILSINVGDIVLNDKILDKGKYRSIEKKMVNVDFENAQIVTLNELAKDFVYIENYSYSIPDFGNSLFYKIRYNENPYHYVLIPHSEILKRFYLISSYVCNNLSEIALDPYPIKKTIKEDVESNEAEIDINQKSPLYSKFETIISKETESIEFIDSIKSIKIKLNKNLTYPEAYFWTRFILTEKYRSALKQMVLGLRPTDKSKPEIFMKWPISDLVKNFVAIGRPLLSNRNENYFLIEGLKECHDDSKIQLIEIEYDRDNRNESVPGTDPKPKKTKVVKPGKSTRNENEVGGEKDKPEDLVTELKLSRGFILPTGNTRKIEKTTQETKNENVEQKDGKDSGSGGGGEGDTGTKSSEDNADSEQNINYLNWIQDVKNLMYEDSTFVIVESNWTNLLQANQSIDFRSVISNSKEYGYQQTEKKKAIERTFRNKDYARNSKDKSDKRLRKVHYITYLMNDRTYHYIEIESQSTGSECYWLVSGDITVSVFLNKFINLIHLEKQIFKTELKKAIRSTNGSAGTPKKHPQYDFLTDGKNKEKKKEQTIEDIKQNYLNKMIQSLKDLD